MCHRDAGCVGGPSQGCIARAIFFRNTGSRLRSRDRRKIGRPATPRTASLTSKTAGGTNMIQSPFAWIGDQLDRAFHSVGSASDEEYWHENRRAGAVTVRRIGLADLGQSLSKGFADFAANRTDVIFLCIIY